MAAAGKYVLVTGATDGIGLRLARLFVDAGANVIATGSRETADELAANGIFYVKADQSQPQIGALIRAAIEQRNWPRLDHVILNAGIGTVGDPFLEAEITIRRTMDVNLLAPIEIAHGLQDLLEIGNPGRLTLVGSTAARRGAREFASYAASKAGLDAFARALGSEWQGRIDVQIVHPGPIATTMHAKAGLDVGGIARFFIAPEKAAARVRQFAIEGGRRLQIGIGPQEIWRGLTRRSAR